MGEGTKRSFTILLDWLCTAMASTGVSGAHPDDLPVAIDQAVSKPTATNNPASTTHPNPLPTPAVHQPKPVELVDAVMQNVGLEGLVEVQEQHNDPLCAKVDDAQKNKGTSLPLKIAKLSPQMVSWQDSFEKQVTKYMNDAGANSRLISDVEYLAITKFLEDPEGAILSLKNAIAQKRLNIRWKTSQGHEDVDDERADLKKKESRLKKLKTQKGRLELAPGGGLIVEKGYESLDMAKRVTHCSRMFPDLLLCHLDCGNHLSQQRTINNAKARHGRYINRDIGRMFYEGCVTCATTRIISKPPAGAKPIIATEFMNRIQLDLVDMTGFVDGLHEAFSNLAAESQQALGGSPMKWEYVGNTSRASIPAYICNVADHASKVGKSYPLPNKRPEQVALCLLDFMSTYGVPEVSYPNMLLLASSYSLCMQLITCATNPKTGYTH